MTNKLNSTEALAIDLMLENGYNTYLVALAKGLNSKVWHEYMTMAANLESVHASKSIREEVA